MFERLVRQLLLGYLGQYIKDIQKEQLKITLWNEEVLLENVELTLEAFDYLELPVALKHGRVGKLSIKIPWKKLGWDPIIIILEDVFVSACQREDKEWSMDEIGKRESAAKKAKLAAAELAKLSRRVCDNSAGKSFISYITAKILDGIQVSVRNVHILYYDSLKTSAVTLFGMKFSGLTISRQNLVGGKMRGGQVNKLIEVQGLELYCCTFEGTLDLINVENTVDSRCVEESNFEAENCVHVLSPFDVLVSLSVNRSGKLEDDAPQYSANVELTSVVMSMNEFQMQRILSLSDYLSTCRLRQRYGRYRPYWSPLEKKLKGWQIAWWHYAQESVLSDVRQRLKRTSWKYLGERLNYRRKYVRLYKTKLKCLQQDQVIDEAVLLDLEEMEKAFDIDDILSYRSVAELEFHDFLVNSTTHPGNVATSGDKSLEDERQYSKPRGWLNWLSHGVLGAGGTDDSRVFSGVISDDVIKDIYEATKFNPIPSVNEDTSTNNEILLSSVKFSIQEISTTLWMKGLRSRIARWMLNGLSIECKIRKESAVVIAAINSVELFNPLNEDVVFSTRKIDYKENETELWQPSLTIQVDVLPSCHEGHSSVKVILQPIQMTCDSRFLMDMMQFFLVLEDFKFLDDRVLSSVNEINDIQARLLSKIDYILSSRRRMKWDVSFVNLFIVIPWMDKDFKVHKGVLEVGAINFQSKDKGVSLSTESEYSSYHQSKSYLSSSYSNGFIDGSQLGDLYDNYEINISDFEVKILTPYSADSIPILEKFSCSIHIESCIISDEPVLKALDVYISISSMLFHFSPSIYHCIIGLISNFSRLNLGSVSADPNTSKGLDIQQKELKKSEGFWFSIRSDLELVDVEVDLENDGDNDFYVVLSLRLVDVSFDQNQLPDCWILVDSLKITTYTKRNKDQYCLLCSSDIQSTAEFSQQQEDSRHSFVSENHASSSLHKHLKLHYEAFQEAELVHHKFAVCIANLDIHCYPSIICLILRFIDKIVEYETSIFCEVGPVEEDLKRSLSGHHFDFVQFGFSNFVQFGVSECEDIALDHFPFITIQNSGPHVAFEDSMIRCIPDWRETHNLCVEKIQRHKFDPMKRFKYQNNQLVKSVLGTDLLPQKYVSSKMSSIALNLSSIRLHFHDCSCVVATLSLSTCSSSLSICDDCFDIVCSTEGLVLSSSWWCQTVDGFLWGPLSPNTSPILNMRVKKELSGPTELSFSIQHVSCTLFPEFLAVIIGYFALPDWNGNMEELPIPSDKSDYSSSEHDGSFFYKFEILNSVLMTPAGTDDYHFLKLDIQQMLCSFLENSDVDFVLKGIPIECMISADKLNNRYHCLNLFGRDLSLSLLLVNLDLFDSSSSSKKFYDQDVTLIVPLSADIWLRFPIEDECSTLATIHPTVIMAKIIDFQLDVRGTWTITGCEALMDVIDHFSLVNLESKLFKSDVLGFLKCKKSMKNDIMLCPEDSAVAATELRLSVKSMCVRLHSSNRESTVSELIAEVEMEFVCSALLMTDEPFHLDVSFSYISLFSLLNSVILLESTSSRSNLTSSFLDMILSVLDRGKNKFYMCLPCLHIWLHMLDWHEVIVLLDYYYEQLSKAFTDMPSENEKAVADVATDISRGSGKVLSSSNSFPSDDLSDYLTVKLERVGITVYLPFEFIRCRSDMLEENQVPSKKHLGDSFYMIYENPRGFVTLSLQSSCTEIISDGTITILKIISDKVEGMVHIYKDTFSRSWPLFHLFHIRLKSEILDNQLEHKCAKFDVYCDNLEVGLSDDIFGLCQCVQFETPQVDPSSPFFTAIDLKVQLGKLSLLLTDGKWSSAGPLLEILMGNLLFGYIMTESETDGSLGGDLQANYKNMEKVFWEPLVEPWKFNLRLSRKNDNSSLLNGGIMTLIHLNSKSQLNLNLSESMIEIVSRAIEMIKDVWDPPSVDALTNNVKLFDNQKRENLDNGKYAPYVLQNLTSLPLVFHVCEGEPSADDLNALLSQSGTVLEPASSVPIYVDGTLEKQLFCCRCTQSSDRLSGKQIVNAAHHFIVIQLEGTSVPSAPISMDLVGLRYFEVDFSKPITRSIFGSTADVSKGSKNVEADSKRDPKSGFVVPVVIDVSVQRYTKLLQLYSTVIFLNATPVPLEVRFDIPFGVSPKILDPIYPGKEFPLPLHLAEAGRMRWRPLGDTHLWSEAYNVSNIISHESRISFLRPFVCYPSHPSSDPFRCCISVDNRCLPMVGSVKKSFIDDDVLKPSIRGCNGVSKDMGTSRKQSIYLVTLHTPLLLRNYLPEAVTMTIEIGGVAHTTLLSEVETSFFHIDSSHDLTFNFNIRGFRPSTVKFGRAEVFSATAKFSGTKFSLSETLTFDSQLSDGPLDAMLEKVMDAFSGAREICLSVPYLIYNCIGFPLVVSDSVNEIKGHNSIVPSCYDLDGYGQILGSKRGLSVLFSNQDRHTSSLDTHLTSGSLKNPSLSKSYDYKYSSEGLNLCGSSKTYPYCDENHDLDARRASGSVGANESNFSGQSNMKSDNQCFDVVAIDCMKANACMYSPSHSSSGEIMVKLRCLSDAITKNIPSSLWSNPFSLVPPTGSTSVIIPQLCMNAGYLIAVSAFAAPFSGRTKIITFQPRYVISNACGRDLVYRQKGTDRAFLLGASQHSHIEWTDMTRELLFCIRFREPGWQWSGSFSPEHLGDTQVKMRNYISGAVNMMRVEVQSADVFKDDKIVGSPHGNSGTNLILVTDDDTGFMPYRIDNFSKERLRVYQQRCENFETIVHSYTSHTYAWDEPCFPHRLTVEVPGERVIGSYTLDDVKDYSPVHLPATFEKPERTLLLSVHSEGVIKVLSIIDSSYHLPTSDAPLSKDTRKHVQKGEIFAHYSERLLVDIPFIGVSLMNSYAEELLFACAKKTRFDFVQSLDQQKLSLQISFLQIDNQLPNTPYPVILSFDHGNKGKKEDRRKITNVMQIDSDSLPEPVFSLSMAKWRSKNLSLVSLEYVNLRVTDFHLELEQEVILSLFEFFKNMTLRFRSRVWQQMEFSRYPLSLYLPEFFRSNGNQHFPNGASLFHGDHKKSCFVPAVIPIGAPWQHIHLLARKQEKIYVELLDLAPIKFTLSFSSSPWTLRNGVLTSGESLIHRGLMALADIEGAQIHLKELVLSHQLASWESIQDILFRHYTRQSLHEIYKVFGSAGLIGNPIGFARSLSLGIRDFLSVPVRNVFQSPAGLLTGMAQGTTSLLTNTVYAISDAATQFSRAAHKGIVAFTMDEKTVGQMEKQQKGASSHSKGVINEFLEGLTGLLQSPIQGAEKHGLPGVLSGIALGMTGLVAKPAASILEVTGKTALSIRNRSKLPRTGPQRYRVRLPRPLSGESPLKPYSWEEAVGTSVLRHPEKSTKLRDETLVSCKALKQGGKFVIITETLILVVSCSSLVDLGKPDFQGVPANPDWVVETEIRTDSIIHVMNDDDVVHIVGSNIDSFFRNCKHQEKQGHWTGGKPLNYSDALPLFQTDLECADKEVANDLLQLVQSTMEKVKDQGRGRTFVLHQSNLR